MTNNFAQNHMSSTQEVIHVCHDMGIKGQNMKLPSKWKGERRSPAVACWASDHWVASSNPLRGKFRH